MWALLDNNRSCYLSTQTNQTQSKLSWHRLFFFFGHILFNYLLLTIGPWYLVWICQRFKKLNFPCIIWDAKTND